MSISDGIVIVTQISTLQSLVQYDPQLWTTLNGWLLVIVTEIRLTLLHLALYIFTHTHSLLGSLIFPGMLVFHIKLHSFLQKPSRYQLTRRHLNSYLAQFKREFIRNLLLLLKSNGFLNGTFTPFLIIHCPLNSLIVCTVLFSRDGMPFFATIVAWTMAGFEFCCILALHLGIAHINELLNRPVKQFMRLSLRHDRHITYRQRMGGMSFIEAFHTRRKYGFTYSNSFGRISMKAYAKVCTVWINYFILKNLWHLHLYKYSTYFSMENC